MQKWCWNRATQSNKNSVLERERKKKFPPFPPYVYYKPYYFIKTSAAFLNIEMDVKEYKE